MLDAHDWLVTLTAQTLCTVLAPEFVVTHSEPVSRVEISISACEVQLYHATLTFQTRIDGTAYLMHRRRRPAISIPPSRAAAVYPSASGAPSSCSMHVVRHLFPSTAGGSSPLP
jgi:hypothetical protein